MKVLKVIKTVPITLLVVVVLLAIIIGVGLTGVTTWPFLFCLFYFSTFAGMKLEKVLPLAIWGFLGLFGGYLSPIVALALGEVAGLVALVLYLIILLSISLSGAAASFDPICFLMLTLATGITGLCTLESMAMDLAGFGVGVAFMLIVGFITNALAKKAAQKAAASATEK